MNNNQKLPEGWKVKTLNDLGSFSKGKGIIKNDLVEEGLPCIRYAEIYTIYDFVVKNCKSFISQEVANTSKAIEKNTILFAGSGETKEEIGKSIAYIGENPAYAGGDNILFVPQKEIDCIFLSYFLNTIGRKQLNCLGQGDSIVHIRAEDLKRYVKIPFPSLPEQKAIAGTLGIWDAGIEKLSKLIKLKEKQKKAIMQKILTGKTRLNGFSKPWKDFEIGELLSYEQPGKYLVSEILDYSKDKIPVLTANKAFILGSTNDLSGIYDKGDCIIFDDFTTDSKFVDFPFKVKSSAIKILKLVDKTMNLKFIFEKIKMIKFAVGEHKRHYLSEFQYLTLLIPDGDEQNLIGKIIENCDKELALLNKKLALLREQKKSLMQQLLTGKMRLIFK